jgi:hypothetical protein
MKKAVFALMLFLAASLALGQTSTSSIVMRSHLAGEDMDTMEFEIESGNTTMDKCTKNGYSKYTFQNEDRYNSNQWYPDGSRSKELTTRCKSKTSNARGVYTANLTPCTFKYHAIAGDNVKELYLSSACSDSNVVDDYKNMKHDPIEDYVVSWPDECVGDFQRCYLVDRDEKILLRHMCKHSLTLPRGTTHVSVDCTADKKKKKEENDKNSDQNDSIRDPYLKHQQKQSRELIAVVIGLSIICLLSGCVCLQLAYRYGFKPYLNTLKRSKSDPELRGLAKEEPALV